MVSILKLVILCVFAKLQLYIKTFINKLTLFSSMSQHQPATPKSTRRKCTTGLQFFPCIICNGDNSPTSSRTLYLRYYLTILVLKAYPLHECI